MEDGNHVACSSRERLPKGPALRYRDGVQLNPPCDKHVEHFPRRNPWLDLVFTSANTPGETFPPGLTDEAARMLQQTFSRQHSCDRLERAAWRDDHATSRFETPDGLVETLLVDAPKDRPNRPGEQQRQRRGARQDPDQP